MNENELAVGEKDQMIAHFHEVTGIDDFGQCLQILEAANWNLNQAIHNFLTGADEPIITAAMSHEDLRQPAIEPEVIEVDETEPTTVRPINRSVFHGADYNIENIINPDPLQNLRYESLHEYRRYLEFEVEFKNKKKTFRLPDTETLATLKQYCEDEFGVPYKNQSLRGWPNKDLCADDRVRFRDLYLPLKTTLFLLNKSDRPHVTDTASTSTASATAIDPAFIELCTYEIQVKVIKDDSTIEHTLKFDSNKRLFDLKQAVFKLYSMAVNEQIMHVQIFNERHYLNDKFTDNSSLYEVKNYINIHDEAQVNSNKFTIFIRQRKRGDVGFGVGSTDDVEVLSKSVKTSSSKTNATSNTPDEDAYVNVNDTDDDDDDDDENFAMLLSNQNEITTKKRQPLIPHAFDNDYEAVDSFVSEFSKRYGAIMPLFYLGTLDDTIREALLCNAKERRLLGIYLHSDRTVYCNIFCSNVLCDETIVNFLGGNFLVWPWDLTVDKNEAKFYDYCTKNLGSVAVNTLKSYKNKLPIFLVVTRVRGSNEIISIIDGGATKDQMLDSLMHAYELFESQRSKDEHDEQQREERERIKREQDMAYQESLDYDKAKRQRQADEVKQAEEKRLAEERLERETKEKFERRKYDYYTQIPAEPSETDDKRAISAIRLKLPTGEFIQRKFLIKHPLSSIIALAGSLGYFTEEYKLLSSWPRRDLTVEDLNKTLEDLKLFPQETIIIEER